MKRFLHARGEIMVRKFTVTDLKNLYVNHFYDHLKRSDYEVQIDIWFERFFEWLEQVDDELT